MTPEALLKHQASRDDLRDNILAQPQNFKICDQCQCVFMFTAGVCSRCGGYRWRKDREEVIRIANILAKSPFPLTLGTVPRIA